MSPLKTLFAITALGLTTLRERKGSSLVTVLGIGGVVGVLVSVMAISSGLRQTLAVTARPDRVLVLRQGSPFEGTSFLPTETATAILNAPRIKRGAEGQALAAPEVLASGNVVVKGGPPTLANIRGLTASSTAVRDEIKLHEGRWFTPGLHELVAGEGARSQLALAIGDKLRLRNTEWTVVGTFQSNGDARESELLADAATLQSAIGYNLYSSVTVVLDSPASFDAFKGALTSDAAIKVDVLREQEYYERLAAGLADTLDRIALFIGVIMSLGAVFAALNTMYFTVRRRSVEIGTLRAIGFGSGGVVTSVIAEAAILGLLGALLGAALAWLAFSGDTFSTTASGVDSGRLAFRVHLDLRLIGAGVLVGWIVGLIGGLLPAVRAARLPVATALRAT